MKEFLLIILSVIVQVETCCFGYDVLFGQIITKDKKRWLMIFLLLASIHGLVLYLSGSENAYGCSIITVLLVPIILVEERGIDKYLEYIYVLVVTSMLGVSSLYIAALIQRTSYSEIIGNQKYILMGDAVSLLGVIAVFFVIKINNRELNKPIKLRPRHHAAILSVVVSAYLLVGTAQAISQIYNGSKLNYIGMAVLITSAVPILVTIWLIRAEQKKQDLEIKDGLSKEMLLLQKEYYEGLVRYGDDLRRFKHDVKGHFQVLMGYCKDENIEELDRYLSKLIDNSIRLNEDIYTGNIEIDSILKNYIEKCNAESISLVIQGQLPKKLNRIDMYDLCSIFFNLINNATEECSRVEGDRWINVLVASYNDLVKIAISNSSHSKKKVEFGSTEKVDVKNHGMGLIIIKDLVEKYKGTIDITSEADTFRVEIVI